MRGRDKSGGYSCLGTAKAAARRATGECGESAETAPKKSAGRMAPPAPQTLEMSISRGVARRVRPWRHQVRQGHPE